jgi:hypothetical protein
MPEIGHRRWAIAEGYIPSQSVSQEHALVSHEACCILNAGERDAHVEITLYFEFPTLTDQGEQQVPHWPGQKVK